MLAELLELAPAGVEEVDLGGEVVEYAVYGAPGELPASPTCTPSPEAALVEVSTSEIPDDWQRALAGLPPSGAGEPAARSSRRDARPCTYARRGSRRTRALIAPPRS